MTPAIPHLTLAERVASGRAERTEVPRKLHGEWQPAADRRDPVELLEEQATTRVPELVPIRYGRMLVSPFTFFRGAAYLMAADLAGEPRTALRTQLCGDAHLSNFGAFAAPDRRMVFSVNDFDETLPGPFEWDLKRLVASVAVAGRDRGLDDDERRTATLEATRGYRDGMRQLAAMGTLEQWYARVEMDQVIAATREFGSRKELKELDRNIAKMRAKDSLRAFSKLTHLVDGEPRIISDPPLITPIEELSGEEHVVGELVHGSLRRYRSTLPPDRRHLVERLRYIHSARKVVGVGSVGTRCWIVLMLGRDDGDPCSCRSRRPEPRCSSRS